MSLAIASGKLKEIRHGINEVISALAFVELKDA
jgi:hypothetical protein